MVILLLTLGAAIGGALIGVSAAVLGWMEISGDGDVTVAGPVASATQQAIPAARRPDAVAALEPNPPVAKALEPARSLESAKPLESDRPLEAPRAPKIPRAPQALETTRYVGALSIDAAPGGEVFLNRQSAGHTPLRLENLRAGSHLIWIERDGYRRWTRVVQVPANRVSRLSAELEPLASDSSRGSRHSSG